MISTLYVVIKVFYSLHLSDAAVEDPYENVERKMRQLFIHLFAGDIFAIEV